ncbi:hypothetical protein [Streptomyces sp. NPDC050264]|uniref:hypothetical protein n=1 Tax=Streptomyces sp. NPDC050264 TaxID=3155038 RepID=UPI003436E3C0
MGDGGTVRAPEWVQKVANVLFCLVAIGGIGWGGRETWLVLSGRHQIDEACAGLVPAGRVLALSPAGGKVTHRVSYDPIELDDLLSGQECELFSTEAGEQHGRDSEGRLFFTGAVGVMPGSQQVVADDPLEQLLNPYGGTAYPAQPLGGGIAGVVGDAGVVVHLPCAEGKVGSRPINALWARAELLDPKRSFLEGGQLGGSDRNILADTAVRTANNLAERLGCAERLPDAPDDVPALSEGPIPAARAEGTCAWYSKAGYARQRTYPDQVLESRTDAKLWDEQCGLIVNENRATGLYLRGTAEHRSLIRPERPGQWFVSLHTYSGADATKVLLTSTSSDEKPEPAEPGKAGRSTEEPVWWASSICDGHPQVHTMTLAHGYNRLVSPRMTKIFRAYVDDVTRRRGCSDIAFPTASSFRRDGS